MVYYLSMSYFQVISFTLHNNKFWEELIDYFPWYDPGHIESDESNNSSIVARVFVTAVTFLPGRCLATIRGFLSLPSNDEGISTKPLTSNDWGGGNTFLDMKHWKQRVQQFFYCCACIRYRGNVSTKPLPSNDTRIFTEPSRCIATIGGFLSSRCLATVEVFLPSRCLETIGGTHRRTHARARTHTTTWSHKPTLFFSK
jgi:hypothetical protein